MLFTILRVFKDLLSGLTGEGVLACITGALSQARQTRLFARSSKRINFQSSKSSQKLTSRTFFSLTTKTSWQAELSSHKRLNAYFLLINEQQKARNMSRSYWISWSFLASPKKTYSWKAALIPFSWLENTYPWVHVPDFWIFTSSDLPSTWLFMTVLLHWVRRWRYDAFIDMSSYFDVSNLSFAAW